MAASRSRRPVCGLIIKSSQQSVPLKEVSVEAEIRACLLGLKSQLKYSNDSPDPVEVMFRFPLEESSAVVGLTAVIDGRRIKADLREKEEARAAYDDAIASGQSAALAEERAGDIFSVALGNLPPGKDAEIELQIVAELPIDAEENVRFTLPSVFKPRYTPAGSSDPLAGVSGAQVSSAQIAGFNKFQLNISEPERIEAVTSPTHTLSLTDGAGGMEVSLTDVEPKDKDLVILIKHKEPHRPSAVVEEGNGQESGFMSEKAVMVNFFPKFEHVESECEFIFLVDRSGSMRGQFIQSASETLILFMKSLPENCCFNIIGFGSSYELLFEGGSVPYSQSTLDKAVKHLTGLQANLGGTELLRPLEFIFKAKARAGLSRQVFVLTDGAVSNTDACVQKVKQNSGSSRCFTFGIGSGASTALVEGLARAGNGSAEFVKEGERLQPKVIRSLKRALQPAVTDVSVEFKFDGKPEILQSPQSLPPIFAGEKLVVYGIVKTKREGLTGKAVLKGKVSKKSITESVTVDVGGAGGLERSPVQTVHHLAGKALIKDWEREGKEKREIVKLSVESSVVSSHTAFIAVDEENSKPIEGALQTWDLQSHHVGGFMLGGGGAYRSAGGGGRGGGMRLMRKKQNSAAAPTGMVKMNFSKSLGVPKKRSAARRGVMSSGPPPPPMAPGGPSPPPPQKRSQVMAAAPPPPPPAAPMALDTGSDLSSSSSGSLEGAKTTSSVVSLSAIIGAQQANGSWLLNSALARLVGKTLEEVKSGCPTECEGVVGSVWATLLVLELLHSRYDDEQEEWELVGTKAESWTKKQSLPTGVSLDQLKSAAKQLLA